MPNVILNAVGQISFANLADYQHNMLQGLVDSANYYSLGDSRRCLPIRYLKQQNSNNEDEETGIKHKQLNSTYYEYHLTPVLENQMLNPIISIDETKQGMNSNSTGEMVLLSISQPLINDLFDFYIDSHLGMENQKELFKVTDVNFLRTSGGMNIYRIMYETATISLEKIYIEKSFFWFNDFRRFYPMKYINHMKKIVSKDYLLTLRKYYHTEWSIIYDEKLTKEVNLKLNKVILFIKYKDYTNSGELPLILINNFDPSLVVDPFMEDDDNDTLNFRKEDVWFDDPNYDPTSIDRTDPNYKWGWTEGKIPNELAYCVWEIMHIYKPFILNNLDLDSENHRVALNETNVNDCIKTIKNEDNEKVLSLQNFRNVSKAAIQYKEFL